MSGEFHDPQYGDDPNPTRGNYPDVRDHTDSVPTPQVRFMPIGGRTATEPNKLRGFNAVDLGGGTYGFAAALTGARAIYTLGWASFAAIDTAYAPDGGMLATAMEVGDPLLGGDRPNKVTLYIDWTPGSATRLDLKMMMNHTNSDTLTDWYRSVIIIRGTSDTQIKGDSFYISSGDNEKLALPIELGDGYFNITAQVAGNVTGSSLGIEALTSMA